MKHTSGIIVLAILGLLLFSPVASEASLVDIPLYADDAIIGGITYNIANQNTTTIGDWPMYRHDLQGTGASQSTVVNGQLLWKFYAGSSGLNRLRSSPTIAEGTLYIGTENNRFYALNSTTGSQIWSIDVGAPMVSSAAIEDGVVYIGVTWNGRNGYVEALNATNGEIIWQFPTDSGIESSPVVVNGVVYIGSYRGYVYALNASNGDLKWSYLTTAEVYASPSIVSGTLYVGSLDGYVYALNSDDGTLLWASHVGNQVYSSPAIVKDILYVCTDSGYAFALRASDGEVMWQAYIGSGSDHEDASPAMYNGIVYFGARNGFYALNATTGKQIWFFTSPYSARQTTGYFYSSPAVAGNILYCGSVDNRLFALNTNYGSIIWSYQTDGFLFSSPTIANGKVYIASYDGNIYAIGNPANQTPTYTSTPSPTPTTKNPTSTPTSTFSTTPKTTITPTPKPPTPSSTLTPAEAPTLLSKPQQDKEPIPISSSNNSETIDWTILGAIVATFLLTMISLFLLFKKCD